MKKIINLFFIVITIMFICVDNANAYSSYSRGSSYRSSGSSYSGSKSSTFSSSSRKGSNYSYKTSSNSGYKSNNYNTTNSSNNSLSGNSKPDTNTFVGRIEQKIDNYEDRNSTFKSTTKLSAPVNKTSTTSISSDKNLSGNKAYLTSGMAAGVVAGSLASDSKDTFASTSTKNVNNDNSAIIKPSANSPPVLANGLSSNKTYSGLNSTNVIIPNEVNRQNQPTPYVVNNNYNNSTGGGSFTNTLLNYALISSLMGHDKPTVVNNYNTQQGVSSSNSVESDVYLQKDDNKSLKSEETSVSGDHFLMILALAAIILLAFFALL